MKKWIKLACLLVFCLTLAACGAAPEAPAETAAEPIEVEIKLDNWQDYFELRETERVHVNAQGTPTMRELGYGVFLKDEYLDRLPENGAAEVAFEMQVRSVRRQVMGDLVTDNFVIKDDILYDEGEVVLTRSVEDWRGSAKMEAGSDFDNAVAAFFTVDGEFAG